LRDGRVDVIVAVPGKDGTSGSLSTITSSPAGPDGSVNLLSYGGNTGERWNTFVYGNAPLNVARVELDMPGGTGGQVIDGAWVIVLPDRDVTPDQLHWQFLGPDDEVVLEGDGIRTAGS